ncbi:deoxyribodipyrimidine photo-lyase [Paracoccus cavernae]|uniref:Deoxyribodipyrimidine photo-lyase n=1 Tax=Paracoccus cavernae TaxID=1571207 RepID=A0ABT8DFP5_9RHOB|nr:deoxyribodipyrimidine photo-lyase [Paracoccus cavernae]
MKVDMPAPDMPATDTASPAVPAPGIFWLTRDFRFDDNPALLAALAEGPLAVHFFLDRLTLAQGAASRWRLERALRAFDAELRRRTGGTGITLWQGEPEAVFPALLQSAGARSIHQSDWPAPRCARFRPACATPCRESGRACAACGPSPCPSAPLRTQQGAGFKVYTPSPARSAASAPTAPRPMRRKGSPRRLALLPPLPPPASPPPPAIPDLAPDLHRGRAALETFALPAGEAAHARFGAFLDQAAGYGDLRDRPDLEATSGLSEHLALGEISPRRIWARARLAAEADPAAPRGSGASCPR